MSTTVARLTANISLDDRDLQAGLRRARGHLQRFTREAGAAASASTRGFSLVNRIFGTLLGGPLRLMAGALAGLGRLAVGVVGAGFRAMGSIAGTALGAITAGLRSVAGLAAVAGAGIASALAGLATMGVRVGISLESTRIGLETLLRSLPRAVAMLGALRKEARSSVYEFVDLAEWGKRLVAFGLAPQFAIRSLRALGDAVAGLGAGREALDRMILAMGQIKAKGLLSGEEGMQLMEAGIDVRRILKIPVGIDIARLKISADRALPAIIAGIERQFGGMQARIAQTIPGLWSNIKDAANDLSATVTGGLSESLRRALRLTLDWLGSLERTRGGVILLQLLRRTFDGIGAGIERVARVLPMVAQGLAQLVSGAGADRFLQNAAAWALQLGARFLRFGSWLQTAWPALWRYAASVWTWFAQLLGAGLEWVRENWSKVWGFAVQLFQGSVANMVGVVSGLLAVWNDFTQRAGGGLKNLDLMMREFGATSVRIVAAVAQAWLGLQSAMASLKVLGGAASNPAALALLPMIEGATSIGATLIQSKRDEVLGFLSKPGLMDNILSGMSSMGGSAGVFGRAMQQGRADTMGFFGGNSLKLPGMPTLPPFPAAPALPPMPQSGAGAQSADPMLRAADNMEEAARLIRSGASRGAQRGNARDANRADFFRKARW
jgi:tape measure domain-containing protein